jgi:hypothetical protein
LRKLTLSESTSSRIEIRFAPFKPTENTGGYFIQDKNYIALYATPFEENLQHPMVYHEYTHYLLSKHPAMIPKWFNEGLATMFETFELNRGVVKFGNPQYLTCSP